MSDQENNSNKEPPIIIKKVIKKPGHHGGAWKLAYADFVTAMMAFFLVLWLVGLLNQTQKQKIAEYFKKPLREAFIRNDKNDSNIPRYFENPSIKSELAPIKMDLNNELKELNESTKEKSTAPIEAHTDNQYEVRSYPDVTGQKGQDIGQLILFKKELIAALKKDTDMKQFEKLLNFKIVSDGLKISLGNLDDHAMFSLGESNFEDYADQVIAWLSKKLQKTDNKINIIGHTDSQPYRNNLLYSNWELSVDRATAVRRYLIQYGLAPERVIRLQGAGDKNLLDKKNPYNSKNRRIEIILMTDQAAQKLLTQ